MSPAVRHPGGARSVSLGGLILGRGLSQRCGMRLQGRRADGAGRGVAAQGGERPPRLQPGGPARARSSGCSRASWTRSTATRRAVGQLKGDFGTDLYNIQQQLVQLQELTGQSQQRLSELRNQLDVRGAQIQAPAPPRRAIAPIPRAPPTPPADQMYEASLAQLRRGSTSTARLGLREMLKTYPTSPHAADALYFIGQSYSTENPDSASAVLHAGGRRLSVISPRAHRRCTTSDSSPSAGRTSPRRRMRISGWCRSTPNRTKQRSPVTD